MRKLHKDNFDTVMECRVKSMLINKMRGRDGHLTQYAYDYDDSYLYINNSVEGLTTAEIESLEDCEEVEL